MLLWKCCKVSLLLSLHASNEFSLSVNEYLSCYKTSAYLTCCLAAGNLSCWISVLQLCSDAVNVLQLCSDAVNVLRTIHLSSPAKICWCIAFCCVFLSFVTLDLRHSDSCKELELNCCSAMKILCRCLASAITSCAQLMLYMLQSFCYITWLLRVTPDTLRCS